MLAFAPKDPNLDDIKKNKRKKGSSKLLGSSKGPRVESSTELQLLLKVCWKKGHEMLGQVLLSPLPCLQTCPKSSWKLAKMILCRDFWARSVCLLYNYIQLKPRQDETFPSDVSSAKTITGSLAAQQVLTTPPEPIHSPGRPMIVRVLSW